TGWEGRATATKLRCWKSAFADLGQREPLLVPRFGADGRGRANGSATSLSRCGEQLLRPSLLRSEGLQDALHDVLHRAPLSGLAHQAPLLEELLHDGAEVRGPWIDAPVGWLPRRGIVVIGLKIGQVRKALEPLIDRSLVVVALNQFRSLR